MTTDGRTFAVASDEALVDRVRARSYCGNCSCIDAWTARYNGHFQLRSRGVPRAIIGSLFKSGQAAPETGAFLGR
jgi:hypothetical protein